MQTTVKRPKYLNLVKIRLPIPGIVSIAHRLSGVLMFLAIPLMAYMLHLASSGEAGFSQAQVIMQHPLTRLVIVILSWSLFHHLFAGIRYLLIDMDVGVDKPTARASASIVFVAGLLAALITLGAIL